MNIGFIGAGNMGGALARAVAKSDKARLYVCDPNNEKCERLKLDIGAEITSAEKIAEKCDFIFLAVKPNLIASVISEISPLLKKRSRFAIVSMAAGVSLGALKAFCNADFPIVRIMPNTPVSTGRGIVLSSKNEFVSFDVMSTLCELLSFAGDVKLMNEELIDAGTALSGCSPAFCYMFMDALAGGAVKAGLDCKLARELAAKTLIGAATLLLETDKTPKELTDAVCSPGGSTIEGVGVLTDSDFYNTVSSAVIASYEKTLKLGK